MFNMDFGQAMIGNVIVHLHGELLMVHGEGTLQGIFHHHPESMATPRVLPAAIL
jgi:hypothetical protein